MPKSSKSDKTGSSVEQECHRSSPYPSPKMYYDSYSNKKTSKKSSKESLSPEKKNTNCSKSRSRSPILLSKQNARKKSSHREGSRSSSVQSAHSTREVSEKTLKPWKSKGEVKDIGSFSNNSCKSPTNSEENASKSKKCNVHISDKSPKQKISPMALSPHSPESSPPKSAISQSAESNSQSVNNAFKADEKHGSFSQISKHNSKENLVLSKEKVSNSENEKIHFNIKSINISQASDRKVKSESETSVAFIDKDAENTDNLEVKKGNFSIKTCLL